MSISSLLAIEEIAQLKARYFRLMDMKNWDEWEELFVPHASMDMRGEAAAMTVLGLDGSDGAALMWYGAPAIRASVSAALVGVTTVHHGHMVDIEILSPIAANGIWSMEDILRFPGDAPIGGFNGYGHYHETYVCKHSRWYIETTRLTRLLVRPVPKQL